MAKQVVGDENSSGALMVLVSFKLIKEVEERSVKAIALFFLFSFFFPFGNEEQWPINYEYFEGGFPCLFIKRKTLNSTFRFS